MTRVLCRRIGLLPVLAALCGLALLPLAPVEAGEQEEGAEGREATFAGVSVSVDPETGRMRPPSAEEVERLRAGMRAMFSKLRAQRRAAGQGTEALAAMTERGRVVQREDGVMSVIVGTEHLNFSVAKIGPDGTVSTDCVNGIHSEEPDEVAPAKE